MLRRRIRGDGGNEALTLAASLGGLVMFSPPGDPGSMTYSETDCVVTSTSSCQGLVGTPGSPAEARPVSAVVIEEPAFALSKPPAKRPNRFSVDVGDSFAGIGRLEEGDTLKLRYDPGTIPPIWEALPQLRKAAGKDGFFASGLKLFGYAEKNFGFAVRGKVDRDEDPPDFKFQNAFAWTGGPISRNLDGLFYTGLLTVAGFRAEAADGKLHFGGRRFDQLRGPGSGMLGFEISQRDNNGPFFGVTGILNGGAIGGERFEEPNPFFLAPYVGWVDNARRLSFEPVIGSRQHGFRLTWTEELGECASAAVKVQNVFGDNVDLDDRFYGGVSFNLCL